MRIGPRAAVLTTGLVAAGWILPSAASAAPPRTSTEFDLTVLCVGADTPEEVELALDASVDESGERTSGFLNVYHGDVTLFSVEGRGTVLHDDGVLAGSFPMVDSDDTPAGEASFSVELSSVGDPTTTTDRTRTGNAWRSTTVVRQEVTGPGTVVLPTGAEVDVRCAGSRSLFTIRTMPNAFVQRLDAIDIGDPGPDCVTELSDGRALVVAAEGLHGFVSVAVLGPDGLIEGWIEGGPTSGREVSATVPLHSYDEQGDLVPVGDAVVALQVDQVTGQESWELRQQYRIQRMTRLDVILTGTVSLPGGDTVAVTCEGRRFVTKEIATTPAGPRPGGRAPVNDGPGGALILTVGDRASTQTGGTRPEPEADLWCYENTPEDPGFYPQHSVWYRFTGTGEPVTVDTAGSSFNTTLAVYRVEGAVRTEIACVDDDEPPVTSYQAATTIDTVEGGEYVVQVGGLGGEYGLLKLSLR